MHPNRSKPPVNYRNISLALLAIVFIQATVILQLYFVSSSCQNAASSNSQALSTIPSVAGLGDGDKEMNAGDQAMQMQSVPIAPKKKKTVCGTLSFIPSGEENGLPFTASGSDAGAADVVTASLIYPTLDGVTLGGDMVSDGPVPAIAVRLSSSTITGDTSDTAEWVIAAINREYIKMLHITIQKSNSNHNQFVIFAGAAGYLNIHSLHSFGNSYNVQNIQTSDLSSTIVKHAWQHRVDQEAHGYQVNSFAYCVCHALDSQVVLPTSKFESVSLSVTSNDAEAVLLTDSTTTMTGSQITNGPVKCKAYRNTNIPPTSSKALWLLATVNDAYIKIVEVTISHSEAEGGQAEGEGSLSVYASNSGYAAYKEFGTAETEALSGRVVNAAWNKMIPNTYEVSGLSYYVKEQEERE